MAINIVELTDRVRAALDEDDMEAIRPLLADEFAADIADIIERLGDPEDQYRVFQQLDDETAAEVLDELGGESARQILLRLPIQDAGDLLSQMPMDDAVELLSQDIPERQEELIAAMDTEEADEVRRLLQYPPQSAGMLMTERFVRVPPDMTAAQAIDHVRAVNDEVETVTNLYAVDGRGRLLGVLSLREIITAAPDTSLRDLMETDIISVAPDMDQERVARLLSRYDFLALPVVDAQNRILGIITVDDVLDVLAEENTEDLLRFGAVGGDVADQPYFTVPLFRVVRSRFGWLLLLMVADTLTGSVLRVFDSQLAMLVALSFYIPLLIGTGGNTGSQTVSTIIRGMAVGHIHFSDLFRVLRRELMGGLLLGIALSIVAGVRAYLWDGDITLALVIGLSIVAICTWANLIGSFIPLVANRIGIDPAVVSAPMISTLVDATGLFIYMSIATAILGL